MTTTTDTGRLTAQQIEGRVIACVATIRDLWDDMLTPIVEPPAWRPRTTTTGTGALLDDHDPSAADTPRATLIVSIRGEVMHTLRAWCNIITDDHRVTHGVPSGVDVPGMADYIARWAPRMAEHDAARELLDELDDCATAVRRCARPERDTTLYLGPCPIEHTDPDTGHGIDCGGPVRTIDPDHTTYPDEQAEARCKRCGTRAVVSYWDHLMNPGATRDMGDRPLTADQVIALARSQYGRHLTRGGIRVWVHRGRMSPIDPTDPVHTYRTRDVVAALTVGHGHRS